LLLSSAVYTTLDRLYAVFFLYNIV